MNKNTKKLIKLIKEHPNLKILPMIATDLFGKVSIDKVWYAEERVYFYDMDYDDLVEQELEKLEYEYPYTKEQEKQAENNVDKLDWKEKIIVFIGLP